jgi:hypothetical protein
MMAVAWSGYRGSRSDRVTKGADDEDVWQQVAIQSDGRIVAAVW